MCEVTGECAVLDEMVPFLDGPVLLKASATHSSSRPISEHKASLFDHCALALDKSLAVGAHGLPLMGTGDWNDGMDAVGEGGKGESVWLGWFLYSTLTRVCGSGRATRQSAAGGGVARSTRQFAARTRSSSRGWDGDWYRRAYFDDGAPLGSVVEH